MSQSWTCKTKADHGDHQCHQVTLPLQGCTVAAMDPDEWRGGGVLRLCSEEDIDFGVTLAEFSQ